MISDNLFSFFQKSTYTIIIISLGEARKTQGWKKNDTGI